MIGASAVGPRLRAIIRDRVRVEFGDVCRAIYQRPVAELRPIQKEIVASELVDLGWRKRSNESVWVNERLGQGRRHADSALIRHLGVARARLAVRGA
jgi:hypothetical protein